MCSRLLFFWLSDRSTERCPVAQLCALLLILGEAKGYLPFMGTVFMALGQVCQEQDERETDVSLWELALQCFTQSQQWQHVGISLCQLGTLARQHGQFSRSQSYSQAAVAILDTLEAPKVQAHAVYELGLSYWQLIDLPQAEQQFERAMLLYQAASDCVGELRSLLALGRLYAQQREFMFALACFESALDTLLLPVHNAGVTEDLLVEVLCEIAILCRTTGHHDWAIIPYQDVLNHFMAQGKSPIALAQVCRQVGQKQEANHQYRLALECYYQSLQTLPFPSLMME